MFENVFNSDLYADVKGRRDNDSAYYSNHNSSVIENPASVMFHFADKELGSIYESYNSDDEFDQKVKNKKIKAGDFVYDAINGQFRVLSKEDIEGAF